MQQITLLAKTLVQKAGKIALEAFLSEKLAFQKKADNSHLTQYDQQIEKFLRNEINKNFPSHSIKGEEFGGDYRANNYNWLLDPIEGTTNFVSGVPVFCSMIAVVKDGEVVSAAICDPLAKKTYWAEKGSGAFLEKKPIQAQTFHSLQECTLICDPGRMMEKRRFGLTYLAKFFDQYRSFRYYGSMSGAVAALAHHQPLVTFILGTKDYDLAAASLIIQESGCKTFDLKGQPWRLSEMSDFIACSPGLENAVKQTL